MTARVSMRWFSGLAVLAFLLQSVQSGAGDRHQDTKRAPPPVHLTAEQDHQRIMDLLRVTSLRRGVDDDGKSPNAANYDETKANLQDSRPF